VRGFVCGEKETSTCSFGGVVIRVVLTHSVKCKPIRTNRHVHKKIEWPKCLPFHLQPIIWLYSLKGQCGPALEKWRSRFKGSFAFWNSHNSCFPHTLCKLVAIYHIKDLTISQGNIFIYSKSPSWLRLWAVFLIFLCKNSLIGKLKSRKIIFFL